MEIRQKENKQGVLEDFEFIEYHYLNTLGQALRKYSELVINSSADLEELIIKTENIEGVLNDFYKKNRSEGFGKVSK